MQKSRERRNPCTPDVYRCATRVYAHDKAWRSQAFRHSSSNSAQAAWYAWPRSERAEVTIDANLSECHVSAAAGTQYTHAMDDDDDDNRALHHSIKSSLLRIYYTYTTSDGTESILCVHSRDKSPNESLFEFLSIQPEQVFENGSSKM